MKRSNLFGNLPVQQSLLEVEREVRLWRAVLDQAIEDATIRRGAYKWMARAFLSEPSQDFQDVCYLAGLDQETVQKVCQQILHGKDSYYRES